MWKTRIWGTEHSWIIVRVNDQGRTVWQSRWFRSRERAERFVSENRLPGPARRRLQH